MGITTHDTWLKLLDSDLYALMRDGELIGGVSPIFTAMIFDEERNPSSIGVFNTIEDAKLAVEDHPRTVNRQPRRKIRA